MVRTDLAIESGAYRRRMYGADITEETICGMNVTRMKVWDGRLAEELGKPAGRYITVQDIRPGDDSSSREKTEALAAELRSLLPEEGMVLVTGLGNRSITSDALGPETMDHILPTRHIKGELAKSTGLESLRGAAVISPGVLGQTGIEISELLTGLIGELRPSAVIAVDALAARSLARLGNTVQLCDTGIAPGSGVGNNRVRLDRETLGVPVIAVGVPTVVDAVTLASNLMGGDDSDHRLQELPRESRSMIVTPKEIDLLIERCSRFIGMAINCALQPDTDYDVLSLLTS